MTLAKPFTLDTIDIDKRTHLIGSWFTHKGDNAIYVDTIDDEGVAIIAFTRLPDGTVATSNRHAFAKDCTYIPGRIPAFSTQHTPIAGRVESRVTAYPRNPLGSNPHPETGQVTLFHATDTNLVDNAVFATGHAHAADNTNHDNWSDYRFEQRIVTPWENTRTHNEQ